MGFFSTFSFPVAMDTGRSPCVLTGISLAAEICGEQDPQAPFSLPPPCCRLLRSILVQFLSVAPRYTRLWLGRVWCKSCDTGENARKYFQGYWSTWVGFINYSKKELHGYHLKITTFFHNKMACYVSLQ